MLLVTITPIIAKHTTIIGGPIGESFKPHAAKIHSITFKKLIAYFHGT